jgi:hypothetical protein
MKIFKNLLLLLLSVLFALGLAEFGARGICHSKWGEKSCRFDFPGSSDMKQYWIMGYDPVIGVWRNPHAWAREIKSCFDVIYTTNSYGARDREREKKAESNKERWIVLGDSWVEGYGVPMEKTVSAFLEQKTGLEHLNFGVAGTSPLQYLLRYQHMAKEFDHSGVIISFLPFNDFEDMNLDIAKLIHDENNRPFFSGQYPNLQIENYNQLTKPPSDPPNSLWKKLTGHSYLLPFTENIISLWKARWSTAKGAYGNGLNSLFGRNSSYYSFSDQDWLRFRWVMEHFMEETRGKKLVIVSFPTPADFMALAEKGGTPPLSTKMKEYFDEHPDPNRVFIDLLPLMHDFRPDFEPYFLSCDSHMSPYGHEVAAELIYQQLKDKFYSSQK